MKKLSKSNLLNSYFADYNTDLKSSHFVSMLLFNTIDRKKRIVDSIGEYLEKFGKSYPHVALCHSVSSINEVKDKLRKDGGLLVLDYDTWFKEVSYQTMFRPTSINRSAEQILNELIFIRHHSNIKIIAYSSESELIMTLQYHSMILKPEDFYSRYIHDGHHILTYN